jgi:hypothetical protein
MVKFEISSNSKQNFYDSFSRGNGDFAQDEKTEKHTEEGTYVMKISFHTQIDENWRKIFDKKLRSV